MRSITNHQANPANESLTVEAEQTLGPGGAPHYYRIGFKPGMDAPMVNLPVEIHFQHGPIQNGMINGVTQEALLAIVIDRLTHFQAGQFACEENVDALLLCEEALDVLKTRTRNRLARGVEGKNVA